MLKREELTNPSSCLNRADDDERVFVLLARDPAAAATIRFWARHRIDLRKNGNGDAQIVEAINAADEMERYAKAREEAKTVKTVTRPPATVPFASEPTAPPSAKKK